MSVLIMARKAAIDWVNKVDLCTLTHTLPPEVFEERQKLHTPRIDPIGPDLNKIRKVMKRSNMSPAARKAVSARMKKYWADRRKQKTKKK
jgi:hypothetical protein